MIKIPIKKLLIIATNKGSRDSTYSDLDCSTSRPRGYSRARKDILSWASSNYDIERCAVIIHSDVGRKGRADSLARFARKRLPGAFIIGLTDRTWPGNPVITGSLYNAVVDAPDYRTRMNLLASSIPYWLKKSTPSFDASSRYGPYD